MKILLISSYLPYPLYSGGQVRLFNLIRELSDKHEITLVCEKRSHQTVTDVVEVEKICKKVITVERKKQWGVGNILKTSLSMNSFLKTGHTHTDLKSKIEKELADTNFDLIHVETFYVMQNLPSVTIPVILVEHNIEYLVYKRFVDKATVLAKPLLKLDVAKIKREEEMLWKRADRLVAVSESDAEVMKLEGIEPAIVANGVDIDKFSFKSSVESHQSSFKKILFIGDFKWMQNRDAVKYIIEEIWPQIRSRIKDQGLKISLWIVARNIPDSVRNLTSDPSIVFDEESSDKPTEKLFQEADILLAPIRIGGGTSYKILESMSCGTPVVTTTMSAGAIGAIDGENIMAGKNAQELAEKTLELISDRKLYETIAENGRIIIEEKYTWKKIAGDLEKVYKSIT